ncbi:MAG: YbjQ family protein [Bryobacterales bacterium]|nr:YbjQ family protein [Bryobacterales bacterium]
MIVITASYIAGKRVKRTLGLVRGNTVRAKHLGRDILAAFRNIVGGEVHEYTRLLAQAREQALDRMVEEAHSLGADAVIELRFTTAEIGKNLAEIMAYGTAVVTEDE